MVPAGKSPRSISEAQRMERAMRAAEKPKEAPQASPKGSGTRKGNTASSTPSSASAKTRSEQDRIDAIGRRIDKGREARSGDPRTQSGYNDIFRRPAQPRTQAIAIGNIPSQPPVTQTSGGSSNPGLGAGSAADRTPLRGSARGRVETPSVADSSRPRGSVEYARRVNEAQLNQYPKITEEILSQLSATQKRTLSANGSVTFRGKRYRK